MQYGIPELSISNVDLAPALPDANDPEVQVWRDLDGTICGYGHTVGGAYWMHLPGLASFCFGGGEDRVTAIADPPVREDQILDAYHRNVLPMVLQARGQEVLHASAVLTPRGVVALCAVSKTGKSTMAFGLSRRGWPLWADDAVAFETLDSSVRAIPLPFGVRLRPESTAFFDQDSVTVGANPSRIDDRVEAEPTQLAALFLLNRVHEGNDSAAVQIHELSSAQAFTDVLAHAYCFSFQDVERNRSMMRHYLELVARIPVFKIRFRPGFETFPAVLDGISQLLDKTFECEAASVHDA
ncbi:MAG: hypothetical protein H0T57_15655 [Rubrobacter sp.]|nr:hypothetical protein [Rubrobacter sp.]